MDNNNSLSDRLRRLDHHSSVASEFRVHTRNGAILSTIFIFVTTYLIYTELQYNLTPSVRDKVHVNATSPAGLEMEFEVTFPSVPCALVNVDANDPNGQKQSLHLDRKHRVWKHRIDADGNMIGHKSRFEMGNTFAHEDHIRDHAKDQGLKFLEEYDDHLNDDEEEDCGSCYGAGDDGECCNTCDDVKRAYQRKGWMFDNKIEIRQCRSEKTSEEEKGEGCNVHGIVALDSGGGNLHLAPGRGMENFGKQFMFENLADLIMQAFETFNVSHTVHKLRFGQEMPGHIHQLDGQERMIEDAYGMYQYYIQVVPTLYKFLNGKLKISYIMKV